MPKTLRRKTPTTQNRTTRRGVYRTERLKDKIIVNDSDGRFVISVPLNARGEIPKGYAFERLLDIYAGTRRGRKRNPTVDQSRKAAKIFKRSDEDAFLWVLYPNESDLEGVDTSAVAPPPKRAIRTENDLSTIAGVDAEIKGINKRINAASKAGRPLDELLDNRQGLVEYREGLVASNLSERDYERLWEARDELADKELELAGREEAASAIEKPSWGKGISNETLLSIAEHEGLNPYIPDWGDSLDPVVISEARQGRLKRRANVQTISDMRAEVRALRKQVDQLERAESKPEPISIPAPQKPATTSNAPTTFTKGDEARFTGNTKIVGGHTFYEVELLEGHMVGQTALVPYPPGGEAEYGEQQRKRISKEWEAEQAGFKRLHEHQSAGQMQGGFGIGEKAPQGTLLGEFRDDGGKTKLIDDTSLVERERLAREKAKGQRALPDRSLDTMSEAIALSSPSGRMSKRARDAANKRLAEQLFGAGGLTKEQLGYGAKKETLESKRTRLLRTATELRELAERGFKPKAYRKKADQLEKEALALV